MKQATLLINCERGFDDPELRFIFDVLHSHLINFKIEASLVDECLVHIGYNEAINGKTHEGFVGFADGDTMSLVVYYGSYEEEFKGIPIEDAAVAIAHSILKNDYRCRHCVVNTRKKLGE